MLGLLKSLSLIPRLLLVPKTAPSAQNRFIYYPNTLQRLPSNLLSLPKALFLPSLKGILKGAWHDFRTPSRFARPKSESALEKERQRAREQDADESISTFIVRRMGKSGELLRDRLFSAVLHGIYAGSPHVLSVRSTLGALWKAEQRHGSPVRAALPSWLNKGKRRLTSQEKAADEAAAKEVSRYEEELGDEIVGRMKPISVYSLPEGVGEITQAIVDELERMPNAHFVLNAPVTDIVGREGRSLKLSTPDSTYSASRIVAAQPSASLDRSISTSLPWLSHNPGANVGVVNVIFPSSLASHFLSGAKARLLPVEGFGYLIPTATENEDGVLGVVFDSDSLPDQDVAAHTPTGQTPTKLTVMIGGPHWTFKREHNFPKEQELVDIAKRALHSHLGLSKDLLEDRSAVYRAKLQLKCIPHYAVGHIARMRDLDDKLRAHPEFGNGRLVLAGASYTGVSLNDCVLHARRLADRIIAEERLGSGSGSSRSITGLESFVEDRTFALQSGAINLNG
ncbi:Protoporphyrinogen oxidase [Ceraceosorus bombacis]|uniref:Protoporphyrinogen oxidase n=1 Tax=Ceraceosorus bombacis TaxID=401625 RepID=A0A0P1BJY0_9BASI|nr:Protoporphyrinogen oxidase [Ceraceosorus bombacis]